MSTRKTVRRKATPRRNAGYPGAGHEPDAGMETKDILRDVLRRYRGQPREVIGHETGRREGRQAAYRLAHQPPLRAVGTDEFRKRAFGLAEAGAVGLRWAIKDHFPGLAGGAAGLQQMVEAYSVGFGQGVLQWTREQMAEAERSEARANPGRRARRCSRR
jgi:hypothetical protein